MARWSFVCGALTAVFAVTGIAAPQFSEPAHQDVVVEAYPPNTSFATGRVTWTGGTNYGKYSGTIEFGTSVAGTHRGFIKFDLSGLPSGIQVTEVVLGYHCFYRYANRPSTAVRALSVDPVTANAPSLWSAYASGTVVADSVTHDTGWVYRTLNAAGAAAVQAGLSQGWVAFGLEEWNGVLNYGGRADAYNSSLRPVLLVGFIADIDLAVAACGPLSYPLVEGESETLYVDVANAGANTVSGARVVLMRDSVTVDSVLLPALLPGTQVRRSFVQQLPRSGGNRVNYRFIARKEGDANPQNDEGGYDDWTFIRGTWWAEGFDLAPSFPPPGWAVINADNGMYTWGNGTPATAHAGTGHGRCPNETGLRVDDWLITPPLFLTPGYQDSLALFLRTLAGTGNDTLQVWIMNGPNPVDTVSRVATYIFASTLYFERHIGLHDWSGQTVRIGLRKRSRSSNSLLVDNVSMLRRPRIDAAAEALVAPTGDIRLPVSERPAVRVRNLGVAEATLSLRTVIRRGLAVVYDTIETGITVAAGDTLTRVFSRQWVTLDTGIYSVTAFVGLAGDGCRWNDTVRGEVRVRPASSGVWREAASLPLTPSGRPVKDGGWLVWLEGPGRAYAAKGNKTGDLYVYDPQAGVWLERASWPMGRENKGPAKGAGATGDGSGRIYAVKGNNTAAFWCFDATTNTWTQLADVPAGPSNKRVKAGGGLVWADGHVYLLKGPGCEFWRYSPSGDSWTQLTDAPRGILPKWDRGSWLVADGAGHIWAHKAKAGELWCYDIAADSWTQYQPGGIPSYSLVTGQRKKARDGSAAAWYNGMIYALKGGNTQEFWRLEVARGRWVELDTIPAYGRVGERRRIKGGGDLVAGADELFALKGGKSNEVWTWGPLSSGIAGNSLGGDGLQSAGYETRNRLQIEPNPARSGAVVCWSLSGPGQAGELTVGDAAGRVFFRRTLTAGEKQGSLCLPALSSGVYWLRVGGQTKRLVVF